MASIDVMLVWGRVGMFRKFVVLATRVGHATAFVLGVAVLVALV